QYAGGSSADCRASPTQITQAVFASLPSETERRGQGGSGTQVSGTTLLDAAHPDRVSRDRSHREQLAGAPGRRKLDRWIDWALSHPAPGRDVRIEESWSRFGPNRWLVERVPP